MHLDNLLRNGKAEAGSAFLFCDRRIGLLKFLENFALIRFCDPWTGVTHRQSDRPVCRRRFDRDVALVGELDRIADEIEQDLSEPAFVAVRGRNLLRKFDF